MCVCVYRPTTEPFQIRVVGVDRGRSGVQEQYDGEVAGEGGVGVRAPSDLQTSMGLKPPRAEPAFQTVCANTLQ